MTDPEFLLEARAIGFRQRLGTGFVHHQQRAVAQQQSPLPRLQQPGAVGHQQVIGIGIVGIARQARQKLTHAGGLAHLARTDQRYCRLAVKRIGDGGKCLSRYQPCILSITWKKCKDKRPSSTPLQGLGTGVLLSLIHI
mgnify:CR=1 FL=1